MHLSRPIVSGVCKFQCHLLRIRPALRPRCGLRLHPGGRPLLRILRRSAAGQCTAGAGRSLGHLWSPICRRRSCPKLPRLLALQPRAACAIRSAGEYTAPSLGLCSRTRRATGPDCSKEGNSVCYLQGESRKQAKLGGKEIGRIVYSPWGRGGRKHIFAAFYFAESHSDFKTSVLLLILDSGRGRLSLWMRTLRCRGVQIPHPKSQRYEEALK